MTVATEQRIDVDRLAEAIDRVTQRAIRMGVKPERVWHPDQPRMDAITIRNEYNRLLAADYGEPA